MIPLRDVIPSRTTPYVTITIIVLNALAWFYELSLPERALPAFLTVYGVVPAALRRQHALHLDVPARQLVARDRQHVVPVDLRRQRRRPPRSRPLRGLLSALRHWLRRSAHIAAESQSMLPTIGASGAIAGVMGAYFVLYPQSRVLTLIPLIIFFEIIELPAIFLLGFWFVMQLFSAGAIAVTASTPGAAASPSSRTSPASWSARSASSSSRNARRPAEWLVPDSGA